MASVRHPQSAHGPNAVRLVVWIAPVGNPYAGTKPSPLTRCDNHGWFAHGWRAYAIGSSRGHDPAHPRHQRRWVDPYRPHVHAWRTHAIRGPWSVERNANGAGHSPLTRADGGRDAILGFARPPR